MYKRAVLAGIKDTSESLTGSLCHAGIEGEEKDDRKEITPKEERGKSSIGALQHDLHSSATLADLAARVNALLRRVALP
jgi:hypothetical protein